MTTATEPAPTGHAGLVYDYDGSGEPLIIASVLDPAVEGHLVVATSRMLPLGGLSVEQVAALEGNVIKGALAAQAAARHLAGKLDGADLVYRMRRDRGDSDYYMEHLVPRYPELGDAGDPMLTTDPLLAGHGVDSTPILIPSKYAFPPELARDTSAQLALVDKFYDQDYAAHKSVEGTPSPKTGTDVLDKILAKVIGAKMVYEDADLAVIVDRNPATKNHIFVASRECVDNWWKLPPETVAKMAVVGLYLAWQMKRQDARNETGDIVFLTAANQVRHPHDHVGADRIEMRRGWSRVISFMRRMRPDSNRMKEQHADSELIATQQAMASEELATTLRARLAHVTGFYAAMRATTPES